MTRSIDVDTKTFVRFWLVILGFVLLGAFIWRAKTGLLIVFGAAFLAVALKPLARKIDNIDKRKKRSSLSSVLSVVILVLALVAVVAFVGPMVVSETTRFASEAPAQIEKVLNDGTLERVGSYVGMPDLKEQLVAGLSDASKAIISNLSSFAVDSVGAIGDILTKAVLLIVLTIFFMLEGPGIMEHFWNYVGSKNEKVRTVYERIFHRMSNVIAKYVSGQALVAIIDGLVVIVAVFILSMLFDFSAAFAIPMGLVAMICYMIPMFGPIITAVVVSLMIMFSNLWAALVFLVFYIVYEQIENNAISPKIQGKGLSLPPLVVLSSITIGMYAFGLIGTIIAIPIAGCIRVLIEEYPEMKKIHEENK